MNPPHHLLNHLQFPTLAKVNPEINYLSLFSMCPTGKYGENCIWVCSKNCKQPGCEMFLGACSNLECTAGHVGDRCEECVKVAFYITDGNT